MSKPQFKTVKGMRDLLDKTMAPYTYIIDLCTSLAEQYGYHAIETPVLEEAQLFTRAIGAHTDVQKEMFSLKAPDEHLVLRPEGTAPVVRAYINEGCYRHGPHKFYYTGPMFRRERPQKGRYRQFYQFGCEFFGTSTPSTWIEIIELQNKIFKALSLTPTLTLNSIGCIQTRTAYIEALHTYITEHRDLLQEDDEKRLLENPLRILDSKAPYLQDMLNEAPHILDYLSDSSKEKWEAFLILMNDLNIPYTIDHRLVRGLDYYNDFVFEWVTQDLGAQGTLSAGGTYDSLVEELGGPSTPALGFSLGIDRLSALLDLPEHTIPSIVLTSDIITPSLLALHAWMIDHMPQYLIHIDHSEASLKKKTQRALKQDTRYMIIPNQDQFILKNLKEHTEVTYDFSTLQNILHTLNTEV